MSTAILIACRLLWNVTDSVDRPRTVFAQEKQMKWAKPEIIELCVGMEVTSYESAEIDSGLI